MKIKNLLIIILFFACAYNLFSQNELYAIPHQTVDLYNQVNHFKLKGEQEMKKFEISSFVNWNEYKNYLHAIKQDSSWQFYINSFPDSTMLPRRVYEKYINSNEYDNFPVIGISWDNAMRFLRWKTLKDNKGDSIKFVYRLPNCSEWIAAKYYLEKNNISNDFNQNFSDWTINTFDESSYDYSDHEKYFAYDYSYYALSNDAKVLKRKRIIGNSFLHQHQYVFLDFYHYAMEGKKDVCFRYVIDDVIRLKQQQQKWGKTIAESLINYWHINKKW